jgi:hypothetical protein
LRFEHQLRYATFKLQSETDVPAWKPLSWPAVVLENRIDFFSSLCIVLALLCSLSLIVLELSDGLPSLRSVLTSVVVLLTVLNVTTRTLQSGLAVNEDVQRYREYKGKTSYLLTRFRHSTDHREKIQLMHGMERAAEDELRGFLIAHGKAKFIV